jgi:transposase
MPPRADAKEAGNESESSALLRDRCAQGQLERVYTDARQGSQGQRGDSHLRHYQRDELLALHDWLKEQEVTEVAMEATGVYWKPVYYVLEDDFRVILGNPAEIKRMPGRKTDVSDCAWLAQLLDHGMLRPSFIPPREIRELRDLVRYRASLKHDHTRIANRLHKVLQDADLKLSSVMSDILGSRAGRF